MIKRRRLLLSLMTFMSLGLVVPRVLGDPISYNITALGQGLPIGINNQGQVGLGATSGFQAGTYDGYSVESFVYPPTASIYNSLGPTAGSLSTPNTSGPVPGGGNGSTVPWINDAGSSTGITYQMIAYINVRGHSSHSAPPGTTAIIGPTPGRSITPTRSSARPGSPAGPARTPSSTAEVSCKTSARWGAPRAWPPRSTAAARSWAGRGAQHPTECVRTDSCVPLSKWRNDGLEPHVGQLREPGPRH